MTAQHAVGQGCGLLVVEDSPSDYAMLRADLTDSILHIQQLDRAATLSAAVELMADNSYDAVLVDLGLPDSDGLETFDRVAEAAGSAAVIVITGLDDAHVAAEAVTRGAQDYLVKEVRPPGEVARAVNYAIQRQKLLDELRRARDDQLAAKDRFLSHVSHELRSPLAVVHQFASLLLDGIGGEVSPEQRELLAVLMRNVLQLKVMIDDLVDVSHGQRGDFAINTEPIAPMKVISDAVAAYRPLAARHRIGLELVPSAVPDVQADPQRVREVLGNLIDNALKFTPPRGVITVSATAEPTAVRFAVSDTGRGIDAKDVPHIFEQFYQANQGDEVSRSGLGLGLYVSRELIRRQGGDIAAQSRLGEGTTISFTLPLAMARAASEVSV